MTTMQEIYKSRKPALISRLGECKSLFETASCVKEAVETMGYQYLSLRENTLTEREMDYILSPLQAAFPLMESVSKYKLWEDARKEKSKKKNPLPAFLIMLTGIAVISLCMGYYMFINNLVFEDFKGVILGAAVGYLLLFIACFMLFFKPKSKPRLSVEIYADPGALADKLEEVMEQADLSIARLIRAKEARRQKRRTSLTRRQTELFAAMAEARRYGDGEYALERLEQAEKYLRGMGIILLDYREGSEQYFEFLPGETAKTLRPALIQGGKVLKIGLAQIKSDSRPEQENGAVI